jgi:hypothetical protein
MTKQTMEARVLFDSPEDRDFAVPKLIKQGFAVTHLDETDPEGAPFVWIRIKGAYEGKDDFYEMSRLAGQFGGDVTKVWLQGPVETPEEAARSQEQVEEFARLAHNAKIAVEALQNAFCELEDWPEPLDEEMPELGRLAESVASWTHEWAMACNADFDPSTPP